MAEKIPPNVSHRTRQIMQMTREMFSDDSDSDVDSDESYVPDKSDYLSSSEHDTESEISESELDVDIITGVDAGDSSQGNQHYHIETVSNSNSNDNNNNETQTVNMGHDAPDLSTDQNSPDGSSQDNSSDSIHYFHGKKKCFTWSAEPQSAPNSRSARNIIKVRLSKPIGPALTLGKNPFPIELWGLFFTDDIIEEIVFRTNEKLKSLRLNLNNPGDVSYKNTNTVEMNALMGILVLCCIFKSSRESIKSLFSTGPTGRSIFRCIMSEKRCYVLLRALRFDDSSTRSGRQEKDPAAAISTIFKTVMNNFQNNYSIGAFACVDETLVPFRGRVRFKMYMPQKPAKYGIKIVALTDARNSYLYDSYIYTGKGSDGFTLTEDEQKYQKPTQALIRLTRNLKGSHRNITCDNWFSSIEAAQWLWDNGLTMTGTLKKNKPQIPQEFLPRKSRRVNSALYGFTKEFTLLSFVPKHGKAVVLLSSMHHKEYTDPINGKPEIISTYNATKAGVDVLDMKCSNYCANRRTRRWPLAIFYHLIAVSGSNAYILFNHFKTTDISRFEFLRLLGMSLIKDHLQERLKIPNLTDELRTLINGVLGEKSSRAASSAARSTSASSTMSTVKTDKLEGRKNCSYCPYQKNRMTTYKCVNCLQCSKKLCNVCVMHLCTSSPKK